jgi:hypothetical protein
LKLYPDEDGQRLITLCLYATPRIAYVLKLLQRIVLKKSMQKYATVFCQKGLTALLAAVRTSVIIFFDCQVAELFVILYFYLFFILVVL